MTNLPRYDPGLRHTAPWQSAISRLNAEQGLLYYRDRPLSFFLEGANVAWIRLAHWLIHKDENSYGAFSEETIAAMAPQGEDRRLAEALPKGSALPRLSALLAGRQARWENNSSSAQLLGGFLSCSLLAGEAKLGSELDPDPAWALGQAFGMTSRMHRSALQCLLICHADLEINCSTAALRTTASSNAGPWAAMASACLALHGPLHGGASQAVMQQWQEIGTPSDVPSFLDEVRSRQRRAIGFGHQVLKRTDPRALVLGPLAEALLPRDPLFLVAKEVFLQTEGDPFFTEKGLYPNVDYWSGLCWRGLGLKPGLEPLFFAIARSAGWVAHLLEFSKDPDRKLLSPLQAERP